MAKILRASSCNYRLVNPTNNCLEKSCISKDAGTEREREAAVMGREGGRRCPSVYAYPS